SRSVTAGIYYIRVRHLFYMTGTGPYSLVSQFTSDQTDQTQGSDGISEEPRIFTRTFGGGCITNVGGYAKKQICSTSNEQQRLEYSANHLKNPLTNKCLMAQSHRNGSKITYTSCQVNNTAQIFSYNSARKQFIHTASRKCLDVHGGNRRDLILWRCHGGVNQQFSLLQSNTSSSMPPDSALRGSVSRGSVSRGSSNIRLIGRSHIGR
ncbi:MAG: RICIN domain-containing protein, partial [Sulfurovum sp.]|nr:RICIN domain-containing protein [Sulfurovum sp.]MCB4784464.1 RICIN domain-containing protein [Sulfurovum sp.]